MKITFINHACFLIEADGKRIITDPFFTDKSQVSVKLKGADIILLTHAHNDHIGGLKYIYNETGSQIFANYELANHLKTKGYKNTVDLNPGGSATAGSLKITMVPAVHSSGWVEDDKSYYGGMAAGYIISGLKKTVYHAGDTSVFSDMALINELYEPKIGLLPIGGKYTMDAEAAAFAADRYFDFEHVIPMHYNTFPSITGDAQSFSDKLKKAKAVILERGGSAEF